MSISAKDKAIIRDAAHKWRAIADLPVMEENKKLWVKLNKLERTRPLIHARQDVEDFKRFIKLECEDEWARREEWRWKSALWNWELMPADDVVVPYFHSPFTWKTWPSHYALPVNKTRPDAVCGAARFNPILDDDADPDKLITMPVVTIDKDETESRYQINAELYGDIFDVRRPGPGGGGIGGQWFCIVDDFITFRGIEQTFADLIDRPDYVHRWLQKLCDFQLRLLDEWERNGLLSLNHTGGVGSGGLGFTDELPQKDFDGVHVRPIDTWGHATTQIFTEVSPAMHEEFALRYEKQFLTRFGLASYGCCEPLDRKVDVIARNIPNLRRLAMSHWIDVARGAEAVGRRFVFSYRPDPTIFGSPHWDIGDARRMLKDALDKCRGCVVEVVLKDVRECRGEPQRVAEWTKMAKELVEDYA